MVEYNMATEEDHEEIYQLLRTVFNRPEEFLNRHLTPASFYRSINTLPVSETEVGAE